LRDNELIARLDGRRNMLGPSRAPVPSLPRGMLLTALRPLVVLIICT
jgi:hypothetical protein